ncbi:MAG: Hsp20/alpha crystallin family protein [Deltaproteobacteria bacterium]|nr:Hsp20/alpha crystallin family protein [Deltaproteobacteria bacterium]
MNAFLPILRRNSLFDLPSFSLFDRFFDGNEVDKIWLPDLDVSETDKEFIVRAEIPGIEKDDIDITLTDGLLTIKGEKKHENEENKENYHFVERKYGSFTRTLRLPNDVEHDKIDANYKDGVLKLVIGKPEKVEPKKIEIKN